MLLPLFAFAAIAIGVVICCWLEVPKPSLDKWPPITDDEFIARCSPGVNRERALKVRRIIARHLGVDYDRVYPEQRFVDDLGAD